MFRTIYFQILLSDISAEPKDSTIRSPLLPEANRRTLSIPRIKALASRKSLTRMERWIFLDVCKIRRSDRRSTFFTLLRRIADLPHRSGSRGFLWFAKLPKIRTGAWWCGIGGEERWGHSSRTHDAAIWRSVLASSSCW